jgi:hypothetical protein
MSNEIFLRFHRRVKQFEIAPEAGQHYGGQVGGL